MSTHSENNDLITKPTIIITSLGRTGTKFFQLLFEEIVPDSTSLHEPDYLNFGQYRGWGERIRQVVRQLRESGVSNLVVRKSLGKWSLIRLSHARVRGELDYAKALQQVLNQRRKFVHSQCGSVYVESSSAYYGIIDVLKDACAQHRAVYIVRDGRDWVQSKMNWGTMYVKGRFRRLVSSTWPSALEFPDDPYQAKWETMSRFEKLCWAWVKLNGYALATIRENPNARVFRFDHLFESEDRYHHLKNLVDFVRAFPHCELTITGSWEGWLERPVHESVPRFPSWEEWSEEQKQQFRAICSPLMERLGYESY
jgi:hypothetical protein